MRRTIEPHLGGILQQAHGQLVLLEHDRVRVGLLGGERVAEVGERVLRDDAGVACARALDVTPQPAQRATDAGAPNQRRSGWTRPGLASLDWKGAAWTTLPSLSRMALPPLLRTASRLTLRASR